MKYKLIFFTLLFPLMTIAQSSNHNYIKETVYLDSMGTGITNVRYYNGLGYLTETASTCSGTSDNIYTYTTYDSKGRENTEYCPTPAGNTLDFQQLSAIRSASASFYRDNGAYTQNHYDHADRITREDMAGERWHSDNAHNSTVYGTNTQDDKVIIYNGTINAEGFYPAGNLEKKTVTDADGHSVTVFTNLFGQTVLERRFCGDTYYIYNSLGQLAVILPPLYQKSHDMALAFQYEYDRYGQLMKKTLPGAEYTQYWYDRDGWLTFEQDALLRTRGLYRFYIYDKYGRIAVSGTADAYDAAMCSHHEYATLGNTRGLLHTGYNATLWDNYLSAHSASLEKAYYYDNMAFMHGGFADGFRRIAPQSMNNANGMRTASAVRTSDGYFMLKVFCYDPKGNLTEVRSLGPNGYITTTAYTYSLTGQMLSEETEVDVRYGEKFQVKEENTFSARNNMIARKTVTVQHGNGTTSPVEIGYEYDAINRLARVKRGEQVGNVTYGYDVHGWPTSIETASFKEFLTYADKQEVPYYNGRISTMAWENGNYDKRRRYVFLYDGQDRLIAARYGEGEDFTDNPGNFDEHIYYDDNGNITALERYGKRQDGMYGMIDDLSMEMWGNRTMAVADRAERLLYEGAMDFHAPDDTNRAFYRYNMSGALEGDTGRGITMIEYDNMLNPIRIQFANGNVTKYVYSPEGEKVQTIHYTAVPNISLPDQCVHELTEDEILAADTIDYLMDGKLIMKNGRIDKYLFDGGYFEAYTQQLCIMPPPPPSWMHDGTEPTPEQVEEYEKKIEEVRKVIKENQVSDSFSILYYNKDHLGNVREVIDDSGNMCQTNNYYPYGTPFCDGPVTDAAVQPYKYNGKELDLMHGLDTYHYGARQYYPVVPTWDRLDPMCESYTYMSPYSYCLDNPVNVVDPDGKEVFILYQDKKGKYKAFFYNGRQRYVPNNQFVLDFVHTYNYLKANNIGTNVRNAVENADILIGVHEMNITQYINESQMPIVLWESRKGIILSNGKRQSPAVRLEHEFDHAIDDWKSAKNHREKRMTYDKQYGNKEERRVIEGSETRTARKLHQGIRKDHHGSTYPVKDPRFTK